MDVTLQQKAEHLKKSLLFVRHEEGVTLSEKQDIFLVLAGIKPVSFVCSHQIIETTDGRTARRDNPTAVAKFLDSLGLFYQIETDEHFTCAHISLDDKLLELMSSLHGDHLQIGLLYGYPKTAAEAFATKKTLSEEKTAKLLERAHIPRSFSQFMFSKDYYMEELETLKHWRLVLAQYQLV